MSNRYDKARALAIDGALPLVGETLPAWPRFEEDELKAVERVLRSGKVNYWTGEETREFEREYARYLGRRHALALANGTVALELAMQCWGIGPGDDVVVTPRSFIASVSCVVRAGARPVFADVHRDSGNLTPATIGAVLTPQTRAIVCVHLAGWPCDMPGIMALAGERGIKVLEDCAQAHGARVAGRPVGSFGDAAAFSFCQDKIITTGGEGGLLTTDDDALWSTAWSLKDHGKTWEAVYERAHGPGFRWVHDHFGSNYRLTEPQAAIGRVQLTKLERWVQTRGANAALLAAGLADVRLVRISMPPADVQHAWYKFHLFLRPELLGPGWTRDRVLESIQAEGVPCFAGSCSEVYLERAFDGTPFRPAERLPVARELGETSLVLLVHPTLEPPHLERICDAARRVLIAASR
jgi:dTDP-4-amino-4,6-dideoxygalactose transaminase